MRLTMSAYFWYPLLLAHHRCEATTRTVTVFTATKDKATWGSRWYGNATTVPGLRAPLSKWAIPPVMEYSLLYMGLYIYIFILFIYIYMGDINMYIYICRGRERDYKPLTKRDAHPSMATRIKIKPNFVVMIMIYHDDVWLGLHKSSKHLRIRALACSEILARSAVEISYYISPSRSELVNRRRWENP